MKKLTFFVAAIIGLAACNNNSETSTEVKEEPIETVVMQDSVYPYHAGAEFDASLAITGEEAYTLLTDSIDTIPMTLKGNITAACQAKGCWMTVDMGENEDMMVKFKDYEFFVPLDAADHETVVEGVAIKQVTTVAELKHYAQDANASQDSIDAITEPKVEWMFMANGVSIN